MLQFKIMPNLLKKSEIINLLESNDNKLFQNANEIREILFISEV